MTEGATDNDLRAALKEHIKRTYSTRDYEGSFPVWEEAYIAGYRAALAASPEPTEDRGQRYTHALLGAYDAMHRRAQLAEGRAERAEKALRRFTNVGYWLNWGKREREVEPTEDTIERMQAVIRQERFAQGTDPMRWDSEIVARAAYAAEHGGS